MNAINTELLAGVSSPDDLLGDGGVFRQLKKALMERALGTELTHHLRRAPRRLAVPGATAATAVPPRQS